MLERILFTDVHYNVIKSVFTSKLAPHELIQVAVQHSTYGFAHILQPLLRVLPVTFNVISGDAVIQHKLHM